MRFKILFILFVLFLISCSKEKEVILIEPSVTPEWKRFIGTYQVIDTLGNYLYSMEIKHFFSGENIYGNKSDSLVLKNFVDTFDLKIEYSNNSINANIFSIGIHDSVVDRNNRSWHLSGLADDEGTPVRENKLINDTIILYFKQDNIKYYIQEAQPYYYCECKHVAVKQ